MTATLALETTLSLNYEREQLAHQAPQYSQAVNLDQSLMLELIAQSQVVSNEVLAQVAQLASMRNSQVIDVLYESGFVAASDRRAFLDAAQAIRSSWLFKPWAVQALNRALSDFLPFTQVLEELDLHPSNAFSDSALGQLALSCQLIDRDQFNQARQYSLARGLTVGQSLNRCCGLPVSMYKILIDGLARLTTGQISAEQLHQRVRNARMENTLTGSVGAASQSLKFAHSTLGFAIYANNRDILEVLDLLVQSNCLSEVTALGLMEAALQNRLSFESVWDECSPIPAVVLQKARALHSLVGVGQMTPQQAVGHLREFSLAR
jgi:hypothetical protein